MQRVLQQSETSCTLQSAVQRDSSLVCTTVVRGRAWSLSHAEELCCGAGSSEGFLVAALDDDGFSDDESEADIISYEVRKSPCWRALAVARR